MGSSHHGRVKYAPMQRPRGCCLISPIGPQDYHYTPCWTEPPAATPKRALFEIPTQYNKPLSRPTNLLSKKLRLQSQYKAGLSVPGHQGANYKVPRSVSIWPGVGGEWSYFKPEKTANQRHDPMQCLKNLPTTKQPEIQVTKLPLEKS